MVIGVITVVALVYSFATDDKDDDVLDDFLSDVGKSLIMTNHLIR